MFLCLASHLKIKQILSKQKQHKPFLVVAANDSLRLPEYCLSITHILMFPLVKNNYKLDNKNCRLLNIVLRVNLNFVAKTKQKKAVQPKIKPATS